MFKFKWIAISVVISTLAMVPIGALQPSLASGMPRQEDKRESKNFEWVDVRAGDCHMSGVLTIYSNGQAHWRATTWTDHTTGGDIWHETLQVLNSQNQPIFGFGVWDSPRVFVGDRADWEKDGTFGAPFFQNAATATSSGEC
jgi:hypothetical protein